MSQPVVPPPTIFGYNLEPHLRNLPAPARRVVSLTVTAQFAWFSGHFITVVGSLIYLFKQRGNLTGFSGFYRALLGTILSYGIVLYKSHGVPTSVNYQSFADRLLKDENFQYLLLALVWYFSPALTILIIPFLTFSFFHVLSYIRTHLIPAIGNSTLTNSLSPGLQNFVTTYQPQALTGVAYLEVFCTLPILLIGIFLGWSNIYQPLMYAQFLRFRFGHSKTTQRAFVALRLALDKYLDVNSNSGVPQAIKQYYVKARDVVVSLGVGAGPVATAANRSQ